MKCTPHPRIAEKEIILEVMMIKLLQKGKTITRTFYLFIFASGGGGSSR